MNNKPAFTDAQWVAFCADVRKIFAEHTDEVANGNGIAGSKPHIGRNEIYFNGIEDDCHETCVVRRNRSKFEFCKTARKPYDKVVVKVYKLVKKYLPETELSSDGGEAVFGNVVVVEAPNRKLLTYSAGEHTVKVGDTVLLPPLSFDKNGFEWSAKVVATESDYEGRLVEIVGPLQDSESLTLEEQIAQILTDYEVDEKIVDEVTDYILGAVIAHLNARLKK
jgi:hypothetical protein